MALRRSASLWWLGVIVPVLLVAAVLRLWGLPDIPPGPHYDEAANGILASEIARGEKTPLFIPSYTGKEVLYFYTVAAAMRGLGVGLLALRLTAALFGLLTVAATGWAVYELFADDAPRAAPWLAMLAAAFIATSFWHILLSRVGFRAISQPLLQAVTLAALWRGLRQDGETVSRRTGMGWLVVAGLACGLTAYTYLAARAFPLPLLITAGALLALDAKRRQRRAVQIGLFGLAAGVSFLPLGLYFLRHPDAFANRMSQVGPGGDWSGALNGILSALRMLFVRGDPYVRFNLPFRPLLGPLLAALFLVGVGATVWRLLRPKASPASIALARARETLLLAWIPLMLLPTALAIGEITPSNLRAVGLIPLIFVFPARGAWLLFKLVPARVGSSRYAGAGFCLALLLGTGVVSTRAYFGNYAARTDLYEASDGDLAAIARYLNETDLAGTTPYVASIHYRHPTLAFLSKDYGKIHWLVGGNTLVYPATGAALYLFPRSAPPEEEWLGHYLDAGTPVIAPSGPDGTPAFVGYRLPSPPSLPEAGMANFGEIVRVLHYDVARAVSGGVLDVTLQWQILAAPPFTDLIPFYHLADPWGFVWGQAQPFQYAAEQWQPGEVVVTRVQVPIAAGAPPGDYVLRLGFYSQQADQRLPLIDGAGNYSGTTTPLSVRVDRAETSPAPEVLGIRQPLGVMTPEGLTLLGANLDTAEVRPGERLYLTLFWQAGPHTSDFDVGLTLQSEGGPPIPLYDGAPVHGTYPTTLWHSEEVVVDRYALRLPLQSGEATPGPYRLVLTGTDLAGEVDLGPVSVGVVTLIESQRTFTTPVVAHPQMAAFADQIQFLGYDLDTQHARPGGYVSLTLHWRALNEIETDYTVFTHVLGTNGQVVAQQDNMPQDGSYPTTLWSPGEVVSDPYRIDLPSDLEPGDYPLEIGFYVAENGLRLDKPVVLDTDVTVKP